MIKRFTRYALILAGFPVLATGAASALAQLMPGDEYAALGYAGPALDNPVARLAARLEQGQVQLEAGAERGYLDALLSALDVSPDSQVLVFSPTSLQHQKISAATPRALYFNEDTYVGWVQNSDLIELMTLDDQRGLVFYLFRGDPAARPQEQVQRQGQSCLVCHDSTGTMGGGVPLLLARSGVYAHDGRNLRNVSGEGNTTDRTPLAERWGGWYVTGRHGAQTHLGNVILEGPAELDALETLRRGNVDSLAEAGWFDADPYARPTSDIVALLVMEHQLTVQNQLTYVKFKAPQVLERSGHGEAKQATRWSELPPRAQQALTRMLDVLVRHLLLVEAAPLTAAIEGSPAYATWFQARAARDAQGRSLRDFELQTRLFRYPLSYLVHSASFDSLPPYALDYVYRRLALVLTGQDADKLHEHWSPELLAETLAVLHATKPAARPWLDEALTGQSLPF